MGAYEKLDGLLSRFDGAELDGTGWLFAKNPEVRRFFAELSAAYGIPDDAQVPYGIYMMLCSIRDEMAAEQRRG